MEYLQTALALLRDRAYFSRRVDWDALGVQARAPAAGAQSPAACYPAIRAAVEALQDGHSFFIGADRRQAEGPQGRPLGYGLFVLSPERVVTEVFPDSAGERAGIRRGDVVERVNGAAPTRAEGRRLVLSPDGPLRLALRRDGQRFDVELQPAPIEKAPMPHGRYLGDGIGYLELFVQGNPDEAQRYIDSAQAAVCQAAAEGARGWVVDLRCDWGGNMWPMITGAGALMGDGLLGCFINAGGSSTRWFYRGGTSSYQQPDMAAPVDFHSANSPVATFDPEQTPVAVLTSEFTGSSGEMTLISFLGGRTRARSAARPAARSRASRFTSWRTARCWALPSRSRPTAAAASITRRSCPTKSWRWTGGATAGPTIRSWPPARAGCAHGSASRPATSGV